MFSCGAGVAGFRTGGTGGGGGAPTGPAGGDLGGTYPNPLVVAAEETSGPQRLTFGSIPDESLVSRVGTALVAAVLGAGLAFAAGSLTLSDVSNTAHGVVPAITAANAVPLSNGGGTAAVWTALSGGGSPVGSGRLINTTAPLAGGGNLSADRTLSVATVSNASAGVVPAITAATAGLTSNGAGTAATWVALSGGGSPVGSGRLINTTSPLTGGGDLSADRTLAVNVVSNTTSGVAPAITGATAALTSNGGGTAATWVSISGGGSPVGSGRLINTTAPLAGGGDLSADRTLSVAALSNTTSGVAPQTNGTAGQALLATATGSTWSTNFQAQTLTTTGNIVVPNAASFLSMGLAAGSGAGSAAATGDIRIRNNTGGVGTGWFMMARNGADSADLVVLSYGTFGSNAVQLGGTGIATATVIATSINFIGTGAFQIGMTAGVRLTSNNFTFDAAVASPVISHTAQAAVGTALTVVAQQSTGAAGGQLVLASGQGSTGTTSGLLTLKSGAATVLEFNAAGTLADFQGVNVTTTGVLTVGASPVSSTGAMRVAHGFSLIGRNSANSADRVVVSWGVSSTNGVLLGDTAAGVPNIDLATATGLNFRFATTTHVRIGNALMNFFPAAAADFDLQMAGTALVGFDASGTVRNIALFAAASTNFQTGDRVVFLADRVVAPTGNPAAGGFLYSEGGALKWRGSAGTTTTVAPS